MATQSNTISFGSSTVSNPTDVAAKKMQAEELAISKLLATHKAETNNDTNSYAGYGKGLKAFMKAIDLIEQIGEDWAYEMLWQYFVDNKDGSCKEEKSFKGAMVVQDELGTYAAVANLFRHYTMNYPSNVLEAAYVRETKNPKLVLWVEAKAASLN